SEDVGYHRVVDDQFGRDERIDLSRVAAEVAHGLAHGGEVDHGRYAGEVLQDHPGWGELDLSAGLGRRVPLREGGDVLRRDVVPILGAQQIFQQDLQAERQAGRAGHRVQPVDLVCGLADVQRVAAAEAVRGHCVLASCAVR